MHRLWIGVISKYRQSARKCALLLACSAAFFTGSPFATAKNISKEIDKKIKHAILYIEGPRGGLGDIATNLKMLELLKKRYPNIAWEVIVHPDAVPSLYQLEPGIFTGAEATGKTTFHFIRDPNALNDSIRLQQALGFTQKIDLAFSFSRTSDGGPFLPKNIAPIQMSFSEYYGTSLDLDSRRQHSALSNSKEVSNHEVHLTYRSGPRGAGLYLSNEKTSTPSLNQVSEEIRLKNGAKMPTIHPHTQVAFCYSNLPKSEENYLKALIEHVIRSENHGKEFIAFVHHGAIPSGWVVPPHLKIVKIESTSLKASEALIARANLPVLVTGDMSLTLAIEHGKPFVYEMQPWKISSFKSFAEESLNAIHPDSAQAAYLKKMLATKTLQADIRRNIPNIFEDRIPHVEDILALMNDPSAATQGTKISEHFRKHSSILDALDGILLKSDPSQPIKTLERLAADAPHTGPCLKRRLRTLQAIGVGAIVTAGAIWLLSDDKE